MATVRRANVVLTIKDTDIDKYTSNGFDVIDDTTGAVVNAAVPNDIISLRKAYFDMSAEIERLQGIIDNLKAQLKEMQEKPKRSAKKTSNE